MALSRDSRLHRAVYPQLPQLQQFGGKMALNSGKGGDIVSVSTTLTVTSLE